MLKSNNANGKTDESLRSKNELNRRLSKLETYLKQFRSTSPEKWIKDVGKNVMGYHWRISEEKPGRFIMDKTIQDEIVTTIAENEDFIKQKVSGIGVELCDYSFKAMTEGLNCLIEDLTILIEGTNGLIEIINFKCESPHELPHKIQEGLDALHNGLKNIMDDVKTVMGETCLETSRDIIALIDKCVQQIQNIKHKDRGGIVDEKTPIKDIRKIFIEVYESLNHIKDSLKAVFDNSTSVLDELQKELNLAHEEIKTKSKKIFKFPPNNREAKLTDSLDMFADLNETDFNDIDSTLGQKIIEFLSLKEEEDIAMIRSEYAESLISSK